MPQGLPRKLRYAFILQAVMATFAIVIGAVVAGSVSKEVLVSQRMQQEAQHFWDGRAMDPAYPLPSTSTVDAWFVPAGTPSTSVPAEMRAARSGLQELHEPQRRLLVDSRSIGTLYLTMRFYIVDNVILWTAGLATALSLLAVYASLWITYRRSKQLVSPVTRLARELEVWDPRTPGVAPFSAGIDAAQGIEVKQLGEALDDLSLRMREHVQRERDFTHHSSHELRTPLTVIRVATDLMLADPDTSERARRVLLRMHRAGRDMETVIDAFLILARDGDLAPVLEEFDVHDVIDDELDKARVALAGRPVELEIDFHAMPRLNASPHVLALMFGKLLENSCIFTERGRIAISVQEQRIVIDDTGIGMSAEVLQRVYDPFYRADPFNVSGKGMGLPIVRRLGERFGWPVSLVSVPGQGTTATIDLSAHRVV